MSAKAKKPAAKNEKTAKGAAGDSSRSAKAAAPAKKGGKAAIVAEVPAIEAKAEGAEDEGEDEEATSTGASSGGGNAAALAAATGATEMSASFKNFRHHPDMENFYRFIYENDLRLEALAIIDEMMVQRAARKEIRSAKKNAH